MDTREQIGMLPPRVAGPLRDVTRRLQERLGNDLVALVVYGSAARGEHVPKRSDVNLLVVLRRAGAEQLRAAAAELRPAQRRVRLAPVVLSSDELATARDAFAIELTEMQDHRVVLCGDDPFAGLMVEKEHLRLQVEHELRTRLVRLRRNYLRDQRDPRAVARLMASSIGSFVTLLAAMLRLRGRQPAATRAELVDQAAAAFGLDGELLHHLVAARTGGARIGKREAHELFSRYLAMVESMALSADRGEGE